MERHSILNTMAEGERPRGAWEVRERRMRTKNSVVRVLEGRDERELSPAQAELLKNLEGQYPAMVSVFKRYEIPTDGIPMWEEVKHGLTPEVLNKALKLAEPSLLLIPPTTRREKIAAIDAHPAKGQKFNTETCMLDNNDLWNGGKTGNAATWSVAVVEGVQNVAQDPKINDNNKTNYDVAKELVAKLKARGLDVINDLDAYLILVMKGLAEGKPIDSRTYTVLNGKNLTEGSPVADGVWVGDRIVLSTDHPAGFVFSLRVRGLVRVDVPTT